MNTIEPIDDNSNCYAKYNIDSMKKIRNFKPMIIEKYEHTETFLLKDTLLIGQKKFL